MGLSPRSGDGVTRRFAFAFLLLLALLPRLAAAQDTRLIVVAGVGGDEEHTAQFHKWADGVIDAMEKAGMPDADITYLADSPALDKAHTALTSTKENVTKAFTDVAAKSKPGDEVFVLLIGHGSADSRQATFNIPGPDMTAADFGLLLDKMPDQRVVFVNTTSASGPFVDALKKSGRLIVTATKTAGEREDTRFAEYFIQALTSDEADRDRNGRVSVGEAFDYATQKTKDAYDKEHHLQTEHSVLEDGNGGKLATAVYLAPDKSKAAIAQTADPAMRALLEQQAALNRDIEALRLKKDVLPAADYDAQLEKLLTDLALKTREIRDKEAKK
jgi:hypothetical protein